MSQTQDNPIALPLERGFNPLDFPLSLELPKHVSAIAWHEHIPFVKVLIQLLRPKTFVELGVHKGDSYLAICEAASALGLETACFGVDTWQGDEHAGLYDSAVLDELRAYHDPLYGRFSRLVQSTFDAAAKNFADASIDLLHIDGLHTYDAVRHDWELWKPKVNPNGIVLFHDTNVRERDFGVWRLWEELRNSHRHFEFLHGHGLGVLALGAENPNELSAFLTCAEKQPQRIRDYFFALGNRITLQAEVHADTATIEALHAKIAEYDTLCLARGEQIEKLDKLCQSRGAELAKLDRLALERGAEIEKLNAKIDEYDQAVRREIAKGDALQAQLAALNIELDALRVEHARIVTGTSFKLGRALTAPIRALKGERKGTAQ